MLEEVQEANGSLERTGPSRLDEVIPEIRTQKRTIGTIEDRVETARNKLVEQRDMVDTTGIQLMAVGGY